MEGSRPNPDQLLERVQREEEREKRGKLKIFFGASAGVGKTYSMLTAAQEARKTGTRVLVGLVETHGRKDTASLLQGLEALPLREFPYQGKVLKEFDLDAALAARPDLILVDELAHSNVAGSRHPKRWQDVDELLQSGIHVYTSLNVQHLESLNDVVGGITGIRVHETVPDQVFDGADEVVLVDLPPDELLRRLQEGKVYLPSQAERAMKHFFNKGNLIALRELSLRRTADRVDADVRDFRASQSIHRVWATREALLVGVGMAGDPEKAIRSAARLAERLQAPWHAVFVATLDSPISGETKPPATLRALRLAQDMGAETATLPGRDVAETLAEYARSRNITKIMLGRSAHPRRGAWWRLTSSVLGTSVSGRLAALAPDLEIIRVSVSGEPGQEKAARAQAVAPTAFEPMPYAWVALSCAAITGLATWLHAYFELTNIAMLYLLAVLLAALRLGRGPAVFSAFLGVAAFDFFFVPPRFTFAVSDVQYLLTFAVMLAVALITGYLIAGLRHQARAAAGREARSRALYEMARELSGALVRDQVITLCDRFLRGGFGVKPTLLLPDAKQQLAMPAGSNAETVEISVAQWAFDHGKPAGAGTDTLPGSKGMYLPLKGPMRTRGVLAVFSEGAMPDSDQIRQIAAAGSLIAIALERVHYVQVAQDALVRMESERLRNSLLAALSHDVRTPLTALVGLADTLAHSRDPLSPKQNELVSALLDEAGRMNRLVNNLLDMARLAEGKVKLNREWQSLEEAVGSALRALEPTLRGHSVQVEIPRNTPLVRFDAVLMERVLCNLLENAAKYSPHGSTIRIASTVQGKELEVAIADNGPGIAPGMEEKIFEKFTRGAEESPVPGMGLGLSICRAIVEAHGGKIHVERPPQGGAKFIFTLPLEAAPELASETSAKGEEVA